MGVPVETGLARGRPGGPAPRLGDVTTTGPGRFPDLAIRSRVPGGPVAGARPGSSAVSHVQRPAPATDSTLTMAPTTAPTISANRTPPTKPTSRGGDPRDHGPQQQDPPLPRAILHFGAEHASRNGHPTGPKCKIAEEAGAGAGTGTGGGGGGRGAGGGDDGSPALAWRHNPHRTTRGTLPGGGITLPPIGTSAVGGTSWVSNAGGDTHGVPLGRCRRAGQRARAGTGRAGERVRGGGRLRWWWSRPARPGSPRPYAGPPRAPR